VFTAAKEVVCSSALYSYLVKLDCLLAGIRKNDSTDFHKGGTWVMKETVRLLCLSGSCYVRVMGGVG